MKLLIDMDATGNKLSSCKIQVQYLHAKFHFNFKNSDNFDLKWKGKN